jgi:ubiquinol-cytochrome c reductase cytochrome b subunit
MFRLEKIWSWINQRLQVEGTIREAATHPVPRRSASWWYVFGSAALTIFMLQVFTSIMLALIYIPSAAES